jgi:hypothetical protein
VFNIRDSVAELPHFYAVLGYTLWVKKNDFGYIFGYSSNLITMHCLANCLKFKRSEICKDIVFKMSLHVEHRIRKTELSEPEPSEPDTVTGSTKRFGSVSAPLFCYFIYF